MNCTPGIFAPDENEFQQWGGACEALVGQAVNLRPHGRLKDTVDLTGREGLMLKDPKEFGQSQEG